MVVGALGFSCITFFTYALKSSKSYFVLNIFKIGWFHVFNWNLVSNDFQTYLKGFKLKILVVKSKTTQLVEPNEESVDLHLNQSRSRLTPKSTDRGLGRPPAQMVEVWVNPQLNWSRSGSTPNWIDRGPGRPLTQPIKVRVDPQLNRLRVQKNLSFFQNGCSTGRGLVKVQSRGG